MDKKDECIRFGCIKMDNIMPVCIFAFFSGDISEHFGGIKYAE